MGLSLPDRIEPAALLPLLADGQFRPIEILTQRLGVSRAALEHAVEDLRSRGVDIQAQADRYGLAYPVELLDAELIARQLGPATRPLLRNLEVLFEVSSTNERLLEAAPTPAGTADACVAELQHAGRGRRGRRWLAPFGSGIAMSIAWTLPGGSRTADALSLGVSVGVVRAARRAGAVGLMLKWPNDIWLQDRKLGGILLESRGSAGGPLHVVVGIGVNTLLPPVSRQLIESSTPRVAALADCCAAVPSRNLLCGAILDELLSMLTGFERRGFAALRDEWMSFDALNGRRVQVAMGGSIATGIARGVDALGALLLDTDGSVQRVVSGEASLRLYEGDD